MVETNDILENEKEETTQKKKGRPNKYPDGWDSVKNEYFREYYRK